MSPIRRSASTLIERSFGIAKVVPLRPTRRWRKMHGPSVFDLDGDRTDHQDRRGHHQYEGCQRHVEQSLDESLEAEEPRHVEAEQRVVSDRGRADLTMVDAREPGVHAHVGARSPEGEELGVGGLAPGAASAVATTIDASVVDTVCTRSSLAPMWATPRRAASGAQAPTQPRIVQPASACSVIRSRTSVASLPSASTITRSTNDPRSRRRSSIRSTTNRPACTAPVASAVASTELPSPRSTVWSRMMTAAPVSSVARITMRCSKTRPTPALRSTRAGAR